MMTEEGFRVLVVEDQRTQWPIYTRVLKKLDCVCDCVDNARAALEKVRQQQYDLIVLDLGMGESMGSSAGKYNDLANGEQLFNALRRRCKTPILVVSIYCGTWNGTLALERMGPDAYLTKPLSSKAFENSVMEFMERDADQEGS